MILRWMMFFTTNMVPTVLESRIMRDSKSFFSPLPESFFKSYWHRQNPSSVRYSSTMKTSINAHAPGKKPINSFRKQMIFHLRGWGSQFQAGGPYRSFLFINFMFSLSCSTSDEQRQKLWKIMEQILHFIWMFSPLIWFRAMQTLIQRTVITLPKMNVREISTHILLFKLSTMIAKLVIPQKQFIFKIFSVELKIMFSNGPRSNSEYVLLTSLLNFLW